MWIPKSIKDKQSGVDTPIPSQCISNEEFLPIPQTEEQKKVESLINEIADRNSKKLGIDRRGFLRSSMGMAAAFMAMNKVFGDFFDVDAAELWEPAAYAEKWPKKEFIFDVQTHHVREGIQLQFRAFDFVRDLGVQLSNDKDSYTFKNFVKEIFLDSDTVMCVVSGVPGKEEDAYSVLPTKLMAQSRDWINQVAGSQRVISQSNCAPNQYKTREELFDRMEFEAKTYKHSSWKLYPHSAPRGSTGIPWWLDDEKIAYPFYEKSRELGIKVISVHKGFPSTGQFAEHSHPRDIKKAALDNPDLTFVIYHSAFKSDLTTTGKDAKLNAPVGTDGYFEWTTDFCRDRIANPKMTNVYAEIGSSFGLSASMQPVLAAHLLGQLSNAFGTDHIIWGTDSLWWGSPQWQIEAFRRFQIPEDIQKKFGYKPLTKRDKELILGLNAARVYKIDLKAKRNEIPVDYMSRIKTAYLESGGSRSNSFYGWVNKAD
ncbi:MAG: amidohydrolase [Acidobacteria bacterium]|nr:amidohydrolase [Acidobacteriota bacterium]